MFSAYTIKKMLPRLIIAVIVVNLSWYIGIALLNISNVVGGATREIMLAPFSGLSAEIVSSLSGGGKTAIVGVLGVGGIAILYSSFAIFTPILVGGMLALFIGYIVLVIRQAVIVMLLIFSPLIIVMWVLPGGEGLAKKGVGLYMKLLMMYPIIIALLVSGKIVSKVLNTTGGSGTLSATDANVLPKVLALIAIFAPYFMIPFVLKFISGALGTIAGFANDRSRGAIDGLRKRGARKGAENRAGLRNGTRYKATKSTGIKSALNRGLQTAYLAPKAGIGSRAKMRGNINAARSTIASEQFGKVGDSEAAKTVLGSDDLLSASLHGNGSERDVRSYLQGHGYHGTDLDQQVGSIMQARKEVGYNAFQDMAAVANAGTGTGYGGGNSDMLRTINSVAGGDRARATRLMNAARGQAEKAKRVDLYGSSFGTQLGQMNELYETPGQGATGMTDRDDEVNNTLTDNVLASKSAGEIASARTGGLINMRPAIERRLANSQTEVVDARASGNTSRIETAEHEHKQVLAATAGMLDVAGSVSPNNAQVVGQVLAQETGATTNIYGTRQATDISGSPAVDSSTNMPVMERYVSDTRAETIGDQIESHRTDPEFGLYRREYGRASDADTASRAASGIPPPGTP